MTKTGIMVLMAATLLGFPVAAQDLGRIEFSNSCAQCHGADGKGDGPVSPYLLNAPPDLTVLSKTNDGVFPIDRVYGIVDGRADVAVHGGRDMPVWGDRYMTEAMDENPLHYSWIEARAIALNRVLSLVEHISTIQE